MTEIFVLDGNPGLFVAVLAVIALIVIIVLAVALRDMWHTFTGGHDDSTSTSTSTSRSQAKVRSQDDGRNSPLVDWAWAGVPAVALLGVLLYTGFQPFEPGLDANDPANFVGGKLNREAVATVTSLRDYPILWLGPEYQGLKLTSVQHDVFPSPGPDGIRDAFLMAYGSCASRDNCVPPLLVIVTAPGHFPGAGRPPPAPGDPQAVRGLATSFGEHAIVTSAGLVIQVQANAVAEEEVLEALELANPVNFGLPPIGPGESLAPLHSWSP